MTDTTTRPAVVQATPVGPAPEGALVRALRGASLVLAAVAGVLALGLMLLAVADIVRREVTGSGFRFTIDVTEIVLVAVVFAGMASARLSGSHVATPVLTDRLPARVRELVRTVSFGLATLFVVWMTYETLRAGIHSYQVHEMRFGLAHTPLWPAKMTIPLGLAAFALVLLADAVAAWGRFRSAATAGGRR